jgi:hypothetical protein
VRKEIFHLSDVIDKNLQKVFNIDFLFLLELKMLIVVGCKSLPLIALVLNQCIDDLLHKILQLVNQSGAVVVTHRDPALSVPIILSPDSFK